MALFIRKAVPEAEFDGLKAQVGGRPRVLAWARGAHGLVAGLIDRLAWQYEGGWAWLGWDELEAGGWDADTSRLRWRAFDGPSQEAVLEDPGRLPELFRERYEASVAVRRAVDLEGVREPVTISGRRPLGPSSDVRMTWRTSPALDDPGLPDAARRRLAAELARTKAEFDPA